MDGWFPRTQSDPEVTELRQLIESIVKGDNWEKAVLSLVSYREEAIKALIPFLSEKDEKKRWRIILAISRIGESFTDLRNTIHLLIMALKEPELRDNAEKCLSLMIDPRIKRPWVVDILLRALQDENEFVSSKAAELLGELGDERAIKPLIDALKDPHVREKAAWALSFIGKRCVKDLVQTLKSSNPEIRDIITDILVKIGEDAVDVLLSALNSRIWFVRLSAVRALGKIGSKRAIPFLFRMLEDEDLEVRETARKAIERMKFD